MRLDYTTLDRMSSRRGAQIRGCNAESDAGAATTQDDDATPTATTDTAPTPPSHGNTAARSEARWPAASPAQHPEPGTTSAASCNPR